MGEGVELHQAQANELMSTASDSIRHKMSRERLKPHSIADGRIDYRANLSVA